MEKTLAKGLIVLEALVHRGQPCGVSDLAASLGVSKSNAHRLLNTLSETGYVTSFDGRYSPTLKVWELGTKVIGGYDVREFARPAMTRLVRETAEGVRLSVLDRRTLDVIYIDKIDSPQEVRTFSEIGGRVPAHCTSSGKVLLAFQDDAFIKQSIGKLRGFTKNTIVSRREFIEHLKKVRANGYAVNQREFSPQVNGVAAPIFGYDGNVVASLSVAAPADRMPESQIRKVTSLLLEVAGGVTDRMQPRAPSVVQLSERISALRGGKAKRTSQKKAGAKVRKKAQNPGR